MKILINLTQWYLKKEVNFERKSVDNNIGS